MTSVMGNKTKVFAVYLICLLLLITFGCNPVLKAERRVLNNLESYTDSIQKLTFITYPYDANSEIHGFKREKIAEYCGVDFVNRISRGGFWGGSKEQIHQLNSLYIRYSNNKVLFRQPIKNINCRY